MRVYKMQRPTLDSCQSTLFTGERTSCGSIFPTPSYRSILPQSALLPSIIFGLSPPRSLPLLLFYHADFEETEKQNL